MNASLEVTALVINNLVLRAGTKTNERDFGYVAVRVNQDKI
jgi:hypothetical protein